MEQKNVSLEQLSAEDKAALLKELEQQLEADANKVKDDRKAYKTMVNETVPTLFASLVSVSAQLSEVKTLVYNELRALVAMKAELFNSKADQFSHSFTTDDGITLIIGRRYNDGWDDTVTEGIRKVNKFLESLGKDEDSRKLIQTIQQLLTADKKSGVLKASRVLQLKKLADEFGNAEFKDGINIIHDAYRPIKTKEFVTVRYRDNNSNTIDLPLDISSADFDFDMKSMAAENIIRKANENKDQEAA